MRSPRKPICITASILLSVGCGWFYDGLFLGLQRPLTSSLVPKVCNNNSGLQSSNESLLFESGMAKLPDSNYTRTLVVGHLKHEDVLWICQEIPDIKAVIYSVDDPSAIYHVPKNKGHEAMVYLTYIIDRYDHLDDTTFFFHSHRFAWHNNILLDLDSALTIRRISNKRVARVGYFNTRCHPDPGCPDWLHLDRPEVDWDSVRKSEEKSYTRKVWRELHLNSRVPPALSLPCCA